jgi:hypothetical protein
MEFVIFLQFLVFLTPKQLVETGNTRGLIKSRQFAVVRHSRPLSCSYQCV